ncbi:tungstate transport system substrate-binding protein [Bathymodiolus platifrons methanotrophic gill symbiont]|uniref:substrate-binding domain-containing protein n=1 Tax=Bathymodiolus platifrons methanotrophic gill symbiont TaxID=113268 RepID=UPI000B4219E3|nr:substrate-binding domain-containing protein [Bathymodiolus platifrons methanotrophic gill symbiont]MCK5870565.1 substrate-binding domain-containing protein [Methyloprofundus sp.]TXK93588.1 tungsten ABC transporter substrate-binding protein [Methylococcaceae bacterium CS4]TXK94025.1 tungsten ABC transporter substrate-binding protein [Methylococcaceae bacterium CS5]TXK99991.1 tungsten ABC transporter substrate-binding protein [Methylococcaceae bacterium HT1]TXL03260.1 tungsten ABC transporter
MKKTILFSLLYLLSINIYSADILRMSTTTSTENSGLLRVINPLFEKTYDIRLDVIAVGTGKALRLGESGDVDIVFVHAPKAELEFVSKGDGIDRKAVMHNDFVLIGPKTNPAQITLTESITTALQKIAASQSIFISRGDDSGTHKKEMALWQAAKIQPEGTNYLAVGQGMGAVLKIADEKQAYTLTDRGTYIAFRDKIDLIITNEGDHTLFNPYHIMAVNPAKHQHVHYELAKKYIDYVISAEVQALIGAYKKQDEQLFYPDANKE